MNQSTIARTLASGIRLSAAAALLALLAGLLAVTQPARAATYVVTNANDSGPGSLRQAITDANNDPCPDTITFAAAINGTPIILAGAAGEDTNASGDLDLLDGGDLTIQGNGAANTIIDGGGIDRVFHVCPGGGCANAVTLSGVTMRSGSAGGVTGSGGGILNSGAALSVQDSTISANTAYFGGGICNTGGTTTVAGSTVSANTAVHGGGIFNWWATLHVQNSTIGGVGAGNTAAIEGGGIRNIAGLTMVAGSTISANTADRGGGICNMWGGAAAVDGSTVSANTADRGGGIYNEATLNIQNGSTIGGVGAGNTAITLGGGIYTALGVATLDASVVSANTAANGGGIYNGATLHVQNGSTIGGAGAGNTASTGGGGIYNETGTTTVDGSTVSANTAVHGGGIYNGATLHVQSGSTIGGVGTGNTASGLGGGIYNLFTTTVTGSRILQNRAPDGGGLYNDSDTAGATSVTGSCIVGNSPISFLNNQAAPQVATGDWWGAATGPNTPGADTVGGNVDTSGYLTDPPPGCVFYSVSLPLVQKEMP